MKREIKFRVHIPKDSIAYMIMPDFCQDGCFYQGNQYLESFYRRANQFTFKSSGHSSYGAAELMQYTGLVDKNGREVYEGDIVTTRYASPDANFNEVLSDPEKGAVQWDDDFGGWSTGACACLYTAKEVEVIGNIYEHPHLLNSEQEPKGSVANTPNSSTKAD